MTGRLAILLFLCFICSQIDAQKSKPLLQLKEQYYTHYEYSKDDVACEENEEDTSMHVSYIIAYSYPYAKSADTTLANLINRAVSMTFDYSGPSDKPVKTKAWKCIENKPGQESLTYSVTVHNNQLLSLTIFKDLEPMGMGNGFRHDAIPFTFDLHAKKELGLSDILLQGKDTIVYNMLLTQLQALYPGMLEAGYIGTDTDFPSKAILANYPFVMKKDGVEFYVPMTFGSRIAFETMKLEYVKNRDLFREEWLQTANTVNYTKEK